MRERTIVIGLDLDGNGGPAGRIRSRTGSVAFQGWVGLFAALERLLDELSRQGDAAEAGHDPDPEPEGDRP